MRFIVKTNDDLRQEQFAMQMISQISQIFKICNVDFFVKTYEILATDNNCGIMECINDALSIDAIKKKLPDGLVSLKDFFLYNFGSENTKCYKKAQE
jgi:phosphatidylinositol 4-kinase B